MHSTMDIKEIAQKVEDGGNIEELTKDLDEAKKAEFYKHLTDIRKATADKELEAITARRKENERLKIKTEDVEKEAQAKAISKIRTEQITKARTKFMADMGLTEEQMKSVDEAVKSEIPADVYDADLIYPKFRVGYAKVNAEPLIQAQKDKETLQKNALDFNSQAAGGGSSGANGNPEGKTYPAEVYDMVREAAKKGIQLTLEQAARGMISGPRVYTPKKK